MGWYRKSAIWGYTIIPITIVALMTYAAAAYALCEITSDQREKQSFAWVDPSNLIHLMMVSSTRDHNDEDNLDDFLNGFEPGGPENNEDLCVELMDVQQEQEQEQPQKQKRVRKRFKVTNNQVWAPVKTC